MNYQLLIVTVFFIAFIIEIGFILLRIHQSKKELPEDAIILYDTKEYEKSTKYLNSKRKLSLLKESVNFLIVLLFLLGNTFSFSYGFLKEKINIEQIALYIVLIYIPVILLFISNCVFSYFYNFKIEAKYGFNKNTIKRFIKDKIILFIFTLIITGLLVYIAYDFASKDIHSDESFEVLIAFALIFVMIIVYRKLFNKFKPLEEGTLKTKIKDFADTHKFKFSNVYVMDASRRTTKANAYFQGFWKFKKIVLFDTLIDNFTEDEVLLIFAHEIGHYKHKDNIKTGIVLAIFIMAFMYFFHTLYRNLTMVNDFGFNESNISLTILVSYAILKFVLIFVLLGFNTLSRRMEYKADRFSVETNNVNTAISVQTKLAKNHLSNINPHSLDIVFNFSHPTTLQRIDAIKKLEKEI